MTAPILLFSVAMAMSSLDTDAEARVGALIVGNNSGASPGHPPLPSLSYADDDAVRFAGVLRDLDAASRRGAVEEDHDDDDDDHDDDHDDIVVLTRLDDDTRQRALDAPVSGPPTWAALQQAATTLAARPRLDVLYVYFAGHGDVVRGVGALRLEDGVLDYARLQQLIDTVGARTTHVILDSCDAFFAVHARGASGYVWATPSTAGRLLDSAHSDVGVFVSTSAEAVVYEWSELQGGVFSHALRSGLRGAADADLDGRVSYDELAAFVALASADLNGSVYAPAIFARPPKSSAPIIDVRAARRAMSDHAGLTPQADAGDRGARLVLRDRDGLPLVDVRLEAGFFPPLLLPGSSRVVDGDARDALPVVAAARGGALWSRLWTTAFGPASLSRFQAEQQGKAEPVYGLSQAQETRLLLHLRVLRDEMAAGRTSTRWLMAAAGGAAAVGLGTAGAGFIATGDVGELGLYPIVAFSGAVGAGSLAALAAFDIGVGGPSDLELHLSEVLEMTADHTAARVQRSTQAVNAIAALNTDAESTRVAVGSTFVVVGALLTAGAGLSFACPDCLPLSTDPRISSASAVAFGTLGTLVAGAGAVSVIRPTSTERFYQLLAEDPESMLVAQE